MHIPCSWAWHWCLISRSHPIVFLTEPRGNQLINFVSHNHYNLSNHVTILSFHIYYTSEFKVYVAFYRLPITWDQNDYSFVVDIGSFINKIRLVNQKRKCGCVWIGWSSHKSFLVKFTCLVVMKNRIFRK